MAMPQRDEMIEEIKRLDALLEHAVMYEDEAEAVGRATPSRWSERSAEAGEPTGAREQVCGPGVILTTSVKGAREGARVKIMPVGCPQTAGRASRSGAGLSIGRRGSASRSGAGLLPPLLRFADNWFCPLVRRG